MADQENGNHIDDQADARRLAWRKRLRQSLLVAAPIVAVLAACVFYFNGGRYESTDDAYLQFGLGSVSANVNGPVIAIEVKENQQVRAGQVLFRIDPAPFQAALDEAEAQLATARTQVVALRANYRQGEAELRSAQERLTYAESEASRQKALLVEGISSQAQYDQAALAARTARQAIQTSIQQNASVAATLSGGLDTPIDRQPGVMRAQAALERAQLEYGYTVVHAAQDGVVTKVNQLQVGNYVTAARPLFTLASRYIWIEANFKEDQLHYMRLGQPATFKVDAFPDLALRGWVESFSPGTGNSFALLPPENATGNWVKVVQRLPVQLRIERPSATVPLHAGLSVEVVVDTGHRRHLFGSDTPPTTGKSR